MRFRLVLSRVAQQQGIILLFVIAVATLWLAATGHLTLYIHQRYVVFTTGMAGGGAFCGGGGGGF